MEALASRKEEWEPLEHRKKAKKQWLAPGFYSIMTSNTEVLMYKDHASFKNIKILIIMCSVF